MIHDPFSPSLLFGGAEQLADNNDHKTNKRNNKKTNGTYQELRQTARLGSFPGPAADHKTLPNAQRGALTPGGLRPDRVKWCRRSGLARSLTVRKQVQVPGTRYRGPQNPIYSLRAITPGGIRSGKCEKHL